MSFTTSNNIIKRAIKNYGPKMLQFVDYQIHNIEIAKDIVQESFIVLFQNKDEVETAKIESYLFAVARNKIKDHFKSIKKNVTIEKADTIGLSNQNALEAKEIVKMALSKLSTRDKDLITLRDLIGHNYDEIAKQMNLSAAQVKVYLFRARKKLKEEIIKLEIVYEK